MTDKQMVLLLTAFEEYGKYARELHSDDFEVERLAGRIDKVNRFLLYAGLPKLHEMHEALEREFEL